MKPAYYCYVASQSGKTVLELPWTPTELPTRKISADTEDFLTVNKGYKTIIGDRQPWEQDCEFQLPALSSQMKYKLSNVRGSKLKKFLYDAMEKKKPIRFMITTESGTYYANHLVAVTSLEYYVDKKRYWHISFTAKEWSK